jgi:hypothetical protein
MMKKTGIFAGYLFLAVAITFFSSSAVRAGCEKGDCTNGPGIYAWPDGANYTGDFLNGKFHGQGTYLWADGKHYTGEFKNDKRNGLGTYTWANGASYTGEWENGNKAGYGIYTFPDGSKNIGLWENGTLSQKMEESEIEKFLAPRQKQALPAETAVAGAQPVVTAPVAAALDQNADAELEKQLAALGDPLAALGDSPEETASTAGQESLRATEASSSAAEATAAPFLLSVQKLLLIDGSKFKTWESVPLLAVGPINPVGKCSVKIDAEEFNKKTGKLTVKLKIENDSNCALDFEGFLQAGDYYVKVVSWSGDQSIAPQSQKETLQPITLDKGATRSRISFKLQGQGCRM